MFSTFLNKAPPGDVFHWLRSKTLWKFYIIHIWPKTFRILSILAKYYTILINFSCAFIEFNFFYPKLNNVLAYPNILKYIWIFEFTFQLCNFSFSLVSFSLRCIDSLIVSIWNPVQKKEKGVPYPKRDIVK